MEDLSARIFSFSKDHTWLLPPRAATQAQNQTGEQRVSSISLLTKQTYQAGPQTPSLDVFPALTLLNIGLTGMILKGKARCVDSANTVCVQEYHVRLNVDDL